MEKLHVQPSELDKLPYYELEYTIEEYNEILKERNDKSDKSNNADLDKYNAGSMMSKAQGSLKGIKTPGMPSIRLPKF
jgi:hypothetical protein